LFFIKNYQVLYFTRSGKTKHIADAIAQAIGVTAEPVEKATLKENTFLFLGSGCYGGKPGKQMLAFITNNDFISKTVALFGTGGGEGKELMEMESVLKAKHATVRGKFSCKGQFMVFSRGRPNRDDEHNAKVFAKKMTKESS